MHFRYHVISPTSKIKWAKIWGFDHFEKYKYPCLLIVIEIGTPLLNNAVIKHDVTWSYQLTKAVPAVLVVKRILYSCSILHSYVCHFQPSTGFPIDFGSWKLALKVTNSDPMTLGHYNVIIAIQLASIWIATVVTLQWLQVLGMVLISLIHCHCNFGRWTNGH